MSFFVFAALVFGCVPAANLPVLDPETPPQRIISTLPSITEVLFDIGLGDRIVGDSSYTKYPPEALAHEKIGGLHDINREKIVTLKPDVMILSVENESLRKSFSVPILLVDHRTLEGVLDSYSIIGEVFGEATLNIALKRRQDLLDKLHSHDARTKRKTPIRTLICLDRSYGTGLIQNLCVAGENSFLSDVVTRAGGENVAASLGLLAPMLSIEGIIHLAPEVIIDLRVNGTEEEQGINDWQSLGDRVPAVKHRRILTLTDDFASIPGPRTPLLLEKIVRYFETLDEL